MNNKSNIFSHLFVLLFCTIIVLLITASFQKTPGYMDADYYFAGGIQLASSEGFNEPYIWNYLGNPEGIPHPSHSYWLPLASIITAIGMLLFNHQTWWAGRSLFILIAIINPLIVYVLAYSIHHKSHWALISGFLSLFSGYYLAFMTTTDTFGIYLLLGGVYFIVMTIESPWRYLILGIICGLMSLTRTDGILWLIISIISIIFFKDGNSKEKRLGWLGRQLLSLISGYLIVMGGWYIRNYGVFGTLFAPGGIRMFWLTRYDQIFSFPPELITYSNWVKSGFSQIIRDRLWAAGINLQNALATQGSIYLFPLILIGFWKIRKDNRVQIATIGWLGTFLLMSFIFPYAGARGGFIHSGAGFQDMLWAVAPIGLVESVNWFGKLRKWKVEKATNVFLWQIVIIAIFFSIVICMGRFKHNSNDVSNWDKENYLYQEIARFIDEYDHDPAARVIISNPPGFYLASRREALAIPDGNPAMVRLLAQIYSADYLILEPGSNPAGLIELQRKPENYPGFILIGEINDTSIFKIKQ